MRGGPPPGWRMVLEGDFPNPKSAYWSDAIHAATNIILVPLSSAEWREYAKVGDGCYVAQSNREVFIYMRQGLLNVS